MINKKFEAYKIAREIRRSGQNYQIKRCYDNKYGEPTSDEYKSVCQFCGLYHEDNSNIQIQTGDAIQFRTKKIPMILCLYEDIEHFDIKPNDVIIINKNLYKITGLVNIQNWNIVADISLEVVDSGNSAEI